MTHRSVHRCVLVHCARADLGCFLPPVQAAIKHLPHCNKGAGTAYGGAFRKDLSQPSSAEVTRKASPIIEPAPIKGSRAASWAVLRDGNATIAPAGARLPVAANAVPVKSVPRPSPIMNSTKTSRPTVAEQMAQMHEALMQAHQAQAQAQMVAPIQAPMQAHLAPNSSFTSRSDQMKAHVDQFREDSNPKGMKMPKHSFRRRDGASFQPPALI